MDFNDILFKELDTETFEKGFMDIFELSNDFFNEYSNYNISLFGIDIIKEMDIKNYFQTFVNNDNKKAFIAIFNNKIIGYITFYIKTQPNFWIVKKIGDISGLMVNKYYRNKGIGTKLIKVAIEYFRNNGIKYYEVFTSINNKDGISLYKKCGFNELYTTLYGEVK